MSERINVSAAILPNPQNHPLGHEITIIDSDNNGKFNAGDYESINNWDQRKMVRREVGLKMIDFGASIKDLESYTDSILKVKHEMTDARGKEGKEKYQELRQELKDARAIAAGSDGTIVANKWELAKLSVELTAQRLLPHKK